MISFDKIMELIKKQDLIEGFAHEVDHPNYGIYLRLGEVYEMGSGRGQFPREGKRRSPAYNVIAKADGFSNNSVLLEPGTIYALRSYEEVNLPKSIFGRLYPHGIMLASGVTILGDMIEPGYSGHVRLVAINNSDRPFEIDLESLFCKMIFIKIK